MNPLVPDAGGVLVQIAVFGWPLVILGASVWFWMAGARRRREANKAVDRGHAG